MDCELSGTRSHRFPISSDCLNTLILVLSTIVSLTSVFTFCLSGLVFASGMQPLPILKNGSCPYRWSSQGQYCVPQNGAKAIVTKNGPCPYGWSSQHNYCVAGNNAKPIMAKVGSCPYGWSSQHNYCVKN